jgi:hypothetical protein
VNLKVRRDISPTAIAPQPTRIRDGSLKSSATDAVYLSATAFSGLRYPLLKRLDMKAASVKITTFGFHRVAAIAVPN